MRLGTIALCALMISCASSTSSSQAASGQANEFCEPTTLEYSKEEFRVETLYYSPERPTHRAVVLVPPTGGTTALEKRYAKLFCENGLAVSVLKTWTGIDEESMELEVHNRLLGRGQKAIELAVENLSEESLGLFGASVGGIHVATAAGRLEKVRAAFVVAAGAPVSAVIARSEQEALKSWRQKRMKHFQFEGQRQYEKALKEAIQWEPLSFADRAYQKSLGMILIEEDEIVPFSMQKRLEKEWQPQTTYTLSSSWLWNHVFGIVKAWWFHSKDILRFFDNHL